MLQKSVPAQTPGLTTIGGKPAPMRVFTDTSGTQKTSIIGQYTLLHGDGIMLPSSSTNR